MAELPYIGDRKKYPPLSEAEREASRIYRRDDECEVLPFPGNIAISPNGQRALEFAEAGFPVFPCRHRDEINPITGKKKEAKSPLGNLAPKGHLDATTDLNRIRSWWTFYPDALIGIPTGSTGIAVVDVDRKKGKDGFKSLAERGIELDQTLVNQTPNNGEHHIYQRPDVDEFLSRGDAFPGVDIRADGGYIIAWNNLGPEDFATAEPFPEALREALKRDKPAPTETENTQSSPTVSEPQAAKTFKVDLKREWARACEWLDYIDPSPREDWNNVGLSLYGTFADDGFDLWDNWSKGCPDKYNATRTNADQWADFAKKPRASGIGLLRTLALKGGWNPGDSANGVSYETGPNGEEPGSSAGPEAKATISHEEIRQKYIFHGDKVPDPAPGIIKGMIPRTGTGLIIGQSGAGKTFLTIDLGFAVASGDQFFGKNVRTRVGVVFIADEPGMFHRRIEACEKHRRIEGNLPFAYLPFSGDLNNDDEFNQLMAELPVIDAIFREEHGVELGMVVLDTMSKTFVMKDQNSAAEVTAVLKRVDQISQRVNVFSLGVHHLGKDVDRGAAGSYSFEASVDVLMSAIASGPDGGRVRGIVDRREFCLTKYRDGESGPIADYDFAKIDLGVDADGDPVISLAIEPKEVAADKKKHHEKRPTKAEKVFAEAFDECVEIFPIEHFDKSTGEVVTAVDADLLKPAFIRNYGGNNLSSAEKQRKRAWDKLCDAGAYATEKTPTRLLIWRVLR